MENKNYLYATLAMRIKASIIDGIVISALFILLPLAIGDINEKLIVLRIALMYAPLIILEPLLISSLGFTFGQYIFGIHVIRKNDNSKCSFITAFIRYFAKVVLGSLSVIYILFSRKNQAIHDYLAKTLVVLSEKKIAQHPEFANRGEYEKLYDEKYIYPSALRRFFVFIGWYAVATVLLAIIYGIFELHFSSAFSKYSGLWFIVENSFELVLSILFIVLGFFAAQGRLLGARKKLKLYEHS